MSTVRLAASPDVSQGARSGSAPQPILVGIALAVSWTTMVAHNLYELPLALGAIENTGPLVVVLVLQVAYWRRGESRVVPWSILGWALLNLVIGGVVTVLPLPLLPFDPEQSLSHYLAHLFYGVGQIPLTLLAVAALRRRTPDTHSRSKE